MTFHARSETPFGTIAGKNFDVSIKVDDRRRPISSMAEATIALRDLVDFFDIVIEADDDLTPEQRADLDLTARFNVSERLVGLGLVLGRASETIDDIYDTIKRTGPTTQQKVEEHLQRIDDLLVDEIPEPDVDLTDSILVFAESLARAVGGIFRRI